MKILHVNSLYHPNAVGGAERSVRSLAESQLARKHGVSVVTLTQGTNHTGYINGVKVYYVALKNLYWPFGNGDVSSFRKSLWHALDSFNPLMSGAVDGILTAEKPDVVHTHNLTGFSASIWRAATRRERPVVHTLRDYSLLCPKATMFSDNKNCGSQHWGCRVHSAARMALSNNISAVTAVSQFTLDRHIAAGAFAAVPIKAVIHNFLSRDSNEVPRPTRARRVFTFGFMGQLAPAKGLDVLLRAFPIGPDAECELVIAGKGKPDYERILKAQAAGKNVRFLGTSRPEDFYPAIDVLVVPSLWHEPLCRVIIEAYSYGIPVIASDRGGIPELVDHLRSGILFDPDDPDMLRLQLQRLSSDRSLTARLAVNTSIKAKEFSPETVCNQYDEIYSRVTS